MTICHEMRRLEAAGVGGVEAAQELTRRVLGGGGGGGGGRGQGSAAAVVAAGATESAARGGGGVSGVVDGARPAVSIFLFVSQYTFL